MPEHTHTHDHTGLGVASKINSLPNLTTHTPEDLQIICISPMYKKYIYSSNKYTKERFRETQRIVEIQWKVKVKRVRRMVYVNC